MIAFKKTIQLTIVTDFDEKRDIIRAEEDEIFHEGQPIDAEVVNHDPDSNYVDLQFAGGGGVAFGVHRDCFEEIKA